MKNAFWPIAARYVAFTALALLTACTHQAKRVDCDKQLKPINAVAPPAKTLSLKATDP